MPTLTKSRKARSPQRSPREGGYSPQRDTRYSRSPRRGGTKASPTRYQQSATVPNTAWNRIDKNYRSYLRGAGISAEEYNGASLKGKTDLWNNFLENNRRTTMWKLYGNTEEYRKASTDFQPQPIPYMVVDDEDSMDTDMSDSPKTPLRSGLVEEKRSPRTPLRSGSEEEKIEFNMLEYIINMFDERFGDTVFWQQLNDRDKVKACSAVNGVATDVVNITQVKDIASAQIVYDLVTLYWDCRLCNKPEDEFISRFMTSGLQTLDDLKQQKTQLIYRQLSPSSKHYGY